MPFLVRFLGLLSVTAIAAIAAPILSTHNYVRYFNLPADPSTYVCSIPNGAACSGAVVASGTNWVVNYHSESSSDYGVLKAEASVFLTGDNSLGPLNGGAVPFPSLLSVGARGSFLDGFTIDGGSGLGTLNLTFQVTGTSNSTPGQSARPQIAHVPVVAGQLDYGNQRFYPIVNGSATIPIEFTFGQLFEFNIDFYALAQIFQWVDGASASADYSHTALLNSIVVLDSSGNPLPSFTIQSESGNFYGADGVVPEPASIGLIAIGLLAFATSRLSKLAQ